ncbi:thioredoxin family protein [uncultured Marinobacter sp.]|uniref:thioredoxin family protein n=1 Tax=uncultured Marinobacter sp. TaxID=187379 RepID=UPI0030DD3B9E
MPFVSQYSTESPTREQIDETSGPLVIEFGTGWCGYCQAAQPIIAGAFDAHRAIRHLKVEDGKGRRLGRTFGIKLWPTLIFLKDGEEVARVVRPTDRDAIEDGLRRID